MHVLVTEEQLNVSAPLRGHVNKHLADAIEKYFDHAIEATVVLSAHGKGKQMRSDISVHVGRHIRVHAHAEANDAQAAFDLALDRIVKRSRRYKRRRRDHCKTASEMATVEARHYVLAAGDNYDEESVTQYGQPPVIADMTTPIDNLTVGEAAMRMELANTEAFVFQSNAHGGINVLFKRSDGNIGWIDPRGNSSTKHQ